MGVSKQLSVELLVGSSRGGGNVSGIRAAAIGEKRKRCKGGSGVC